MKVKVGVSNKHVHLTKDTYVKLFENDDIKAKRYLNQIGEFASFDTVDLEYNGKIIEHVRVVGPFRNYDQVELLKSDLDYLGLEIVERRSGDLEGTPGITLINGKNKVVLEKGVIKAQRHIHVNSKDSSIMNLYDNEEVIIKTKDKEFNAFIKVSDNGYYELHIDKDEALEYNLNIGDEVGFTKM